MYIGRTDQGRRRSASSRIAANRRAIDNQTVIRLNRDTLYSSAVFDLDAGPVTITMPDAGKRFMSLQIINEDHYVPAVIYGAGPHTFTQGEGRDALYVGRGPHAGRSRTTRRTSQQVHALQDAIKVSQKSAGKFEMPNWDPGQPEEGARRPARARLDEHRFQERVRHQGAGRPSPAPARNGGGLGRQSRQGRDLSQRDAGEERRHHRLQAQRQGRAGRTASGRSASTTQQGYFEKKPVRRLFTSTTSPPRRSADGSIAIQFGGCDGKIPNCLPIVKGWNYTVRLYRPRAEILNGTWKFPEAQPMN